MGGGGGAVPRTAQFFTCENMPAGQAPLTCLLLCVAEVLLAFGPALWSVVTLGLMALKY